MKKTQNNKPVLQMITPVAKGKRVETPDAKKEILPEEVTAAARSLVPNIDSTIELEGIRQKVFIDRYSLKDNDGKPMETSPAQMWQRVAGGIAMMEKTPALQREWAQKFYNSMTDFKFVPAGRILSGAGTGYEVTFFNCYVIPSPKDSRGGIMENITHTVEIQARGGGVGINLSSLRPNGSRVRKVNGTSSGPVSWAKLYSAANHDVIQQGGSRRGALMLMLHDWHPDVLEFVHAKEDGVSIPGANLSVCVSDGFMEAVEKDADWVTKFPDTSDPDYDELWDGDILAWEALGKPVKVYETYKAKDIWDQICTMAWKAAEPGLHFLERSNKWSNTWYFEKLLSTNPCLTQDSWVQTADGPKQIADLIGVPFVARVDGVDHLSSFEGFFKTGTKPVLELQTKEGHNLKLTSNHQIKKITHQTRNVTNTEWVEAGSLQKGDKVLLNNHRVNNQWKGQYTFEEGYLLGLLIGDGTLKQDKAILSVWDTLSTGQVIPGVKSVMDNALQAASTMTYRKDFSGWVPVAQRGENRLSIAAVKHLAQALDMVPGHKVITNKLQKTSSIFYEGFLRGFFDADGSVQGSQQKGVSVRLSQSDLTQLESVQKMLLRLGINSVIYKNRRLAKMTVLPDGKGGSKEYATKAQHELVISGDNLVVFNEVIGFGDSQKAQKLNNALSSYKRSLNVERFTATIESINEGGVEDVYDVKIPGINAFDGNGFYLHNCGEQPLGAWAVCNLGAMNLSAFVDENGQFNYDGLDQNVRVAMRFMDNVVDANYYFWQMNEEKAKEIRRTGIGTMGLGDALIKMKLRYGSEEAMPIIEKIYKTIRDAAYEVSSDLAKEKGSFPMFDDVKYLQGHFIQQLPQFIQDKIKTQGIRNAVILTQAPTGTTSLIAGASSGIEPVFDFKFIRKDRIGEHVIYHPLYQQWLEAHPNEDRPDYFVGANDMTPMDHVKVQALVQKFTDSSISKTANASFDFTVEQVKELYMQAYKLGCKGVTFFRDGSRAGVLYHDDDKKKEETPAVTIEQVDPNADPRPSRPLTLSGRTYQIETPLGKGYVTINRDENNEPYEVFITIGKGGMHTMADAEAIGRLTSMALQIAKSNRVKVARMISDRLRGIGGSSHIGFGKNRIMSLADAVGKVLAEDLALDENSTAQQPLSLSNETMETVGKDDVADQETAQQLKLNTDFAGKSADLCPECGAASFVMEEGCQKCYSCGYSKC